MYEEPNSTMRKESGEITSTDPLVSFLYELMRDHVVPGKVEEIMRNVNKDTTYYTNGWLANYAKDIAKRLRL